MMKSLTSMSVFAVIVLSLIATFTQVGCAGAGNRSQAVPLESRVPGRAYSESHPYSVPLPAGWANEGSNLMHDMHLTQLRPQSADKRRPTVSVSVRKGYSEKDFQSELDHVGQLDDSVTSVDLSSMRIEDRGEGKLGEYRAFWVDGTYAYEFEVVRVQVVTLLAGTYRVRMVFQATPDVFPAAMEEFRLIRRGFKLHAVQ